MRKLGEVVLAEIQFTDTFETKQRPAVILFEEYGNVVVAGITSNTEMKIPTTASGGVSIMSVGIFNVHWATSEQIMKDAPRGGVSTQ